MASNNATATGRFNMAANLAFRGIGRASEQFVHLRDF
jgi:hypothetical protein